MNAALFILVALAPTDPPAREAVDVPPAESTQRKVQDFDARLSEIQKLTAELGKLSGPDPKNFLSRRKDEDVKEYIPRIEALIKTRARLLVDLRAEYERVLVARYTLECELAAYDRWIKANERNNRDFQKKYEAKLKDLRDRRSELRRAGVVVAALLRDKIQAEHDDLVRANKNLEASALKDTLKLLTEATADIEKVTGRLELEKKYEGLNADALRKQLRTIRGSLRDIEFEIQLAEQFTAVETSDFLGFLEKRQQEAIAKARKLLEGATALEDQAAEVEILSRYTSDLLGELASGSSIPTVAVEIEKQLRSQPELARSLGVLTGAKLEDDERAPPNDLLRLLRPDTVPVPKALPKKP